MNYRTYNMANGATFYTSWKLFYEVIKEVGEKRAVQAAMFTPQQFEDCVLNSQACELFNRMPASMWVM